MDGRKIIRGSFRLSLVAAVGVLVFVAIGAVISAKKAADSAHENWTTLRCGKAFIGRDMTSYTNQYGNIDIGRAGCSYKQFLARFEEINEALAQPDPSSDEYSSVLRLELVGAAFYAVAAFVLLNIFGLLFLAGRGTFRWITAGFK
jgi:hypothetical protein